MPIAAIRFNNPGNVSLPIKGYSGPGSVVGISDQSGYAKFPSIADGLKALDTRLTSRISQGYDTLSKLGKVYATDPGWAAGVSRLSGIGVNDTLGSDNFSALRYGIVQQETGQASYFGISKTGSDIAGTDYSPGFTAPTTGVDETGVPGLEQGGGVSSNGIPFELGTSNVQTSLSSLPGGVGSILGGTGGKALDNSGTPLGQIVNGLWEYTGSTATTTSGQTQAKATQAAADKTAKATQAAADETSKATKDAATLTTDTSKSIAQGWLDSLKDLFVRGFAGFFGLVMIAGAVVYFSRSGTIPNLAPGAAK